MSQILISLNFWEYKQLEYWLKDNCPIATVRNLYDKFTPPEDEELYAVEGSIDKDTICMLKLKYGSKARIR